MIAGRHTFSFDNIFSHLMYFDQLKEIEDSLQEHTIPITLLVKGEHTYQKSIVFGR